MLLDTSGLFSYHDRRDARHGDAVTFFDTASVRMTHRAGQKWREAERRRARR